MATYRSYKSHASREEADEQALADARDYIGTQAWELLVQATGDPKFTIQAANFNLAFCGVSGYPFHAFCRRFMLERYRAWMADGDDSVATDEQGFPLAGGEAASPALGGLPSEAK